MPQNEKSDDFTTLSVGEESDGQVIVRCPRCRRNGKLIRPPDSTVAICEHSRTTGWGGSMILTRSDDSCSFRSDEIFQFRDGQLVSTLRKIEGTLGAWPYWNLCCAGRVAERELRNGEPHYRVHVERQHWHPEAEVFRRGAAEDEANRRNNAPRG